MEGPAFLKKQYDLHTAKEVERAAKRTKLKTNESVPQKPEARIQNYLDRLRRILEYKNDKNPHKKTGVALLKRMLHKDVIIDNVPEGYIALQRTIARERGEGANFPDELSPEQRAAILENLQRDQKESLDGWVDYLSSDDALYSDWMKYWAMRSVISMSTYDKEKGVFGARTQDTVAPFPELNPEALAYVMDTMEKQYAPELLEVEEGVRQARNVVKKAKAALRKNPKDAHAEEALARATDAFDDLKARRAQLVPSNPVKREVNDGFAEEKKLVSDEAFERLLSTENFSKYYAFALEHVAVDTTELFKITDGEWRVFPQGSDPSALVQTLEGYGTGWCTAGKSVAKSQLKMGDFHVYYSHNALGEAKIPRLAIRMVHDSIAEVAGVAAYQGIDPHILPILGEKMDDFGEEGEVYKQKVADMKLLTEIERKHKGKEALSTENLRFLYELDTYIKGFGMVTDPRIWEITSSRNKADDLSQMFNTKEPKDLLVFVFEDLIKKYSKEMEAYQQEHMYDYDEVEIEEVQDNYGLEIQFNLEKLFPKSDFPHVANIDHHVAERLCAWGASSFVLRRLDWFSPPHQHAIVMDVLEDFYDDLSGTDGINIFESVLQNENVHHNIVLHTMLDKYYINARTFEINENFKSILTKLKDIEPEIAEKLIADQIGCGVCVVLNNLDNFSNLDKNMLLRELLTWKMSDEHDFKKGVSQQIHFSKYGSTIPISNAEVDRIVAKKEKEIIHEHLSLFSSFDKDTLEIFFETNNEWLIPECIEKFPAEYHAEIARRLIDAGFLKETLNHIDMFRNSTSY